MGCCGGNLNHDALKDQKQDKSPISRWSWLIFLGLIVLITWALQP